MLVNLDDLSADELFELANRKKQREAQKFAEAKARIGDLQKRRDRLQTGLNQAIEKLDAEILFLQRKRVQLLAKHQPALALLDKKMVALRVLSGQEKPPAMHQEPVRAPSPAPGDDSLYAVELSSIPEIELTDDLSPASGADMSEVILDLMKGRPETSESLLRDQLRAKKIDPAKLRTQLEALVKQGKIVSKGAGNFAIKRKL